MEEEYTILCIEWLLKNDQGRLTSCVYTLRGSSIDVSRMNAREVASVISGAKTRDTSEVIWQNSTLPCPSCNKKTVKYIEAQLRRADEGASARYRCTSCLHLWIRR